MIEVYLYGNLREIAERKLNEVSTIMTFEFVEGERFQDCLNRLGLEMTDVGDCYINRILATPDDIIQDRDSLELNPIEKNPI
ncbi:MAG: hypothetical protein ACFFF4_05845 [Candidatus Thorarchaeota archaeon]